MTTRTTTTKPTATAARACIGLGITLCIALAGCSKTTDLSTPKAAAKSFFKAAIAGDVESAKKATTGGDPKIIEGIVHSTNGLSKLRDAMIAKFGDEGKKGMEAPDMPTNDAEINKMFDEGTEQITGDTATLTAKGQNAPLKLKRENGQWKLDAAAMAGSAGGAAAAAAPMMESMGKAASETADEVKAGKYKTAEAARQAFGMKMFSGSLGK